MPLCDYFNETWLAFHRRTMEQEIGNGRARVHPDDFNRCVSQYLDHFHRREPFEMEYRLRRPNGGDHLEVNSENDATMFRLVCPVRGRRRRARLT
jgi:hypothetical protein